MCLHSGYLSPSGVPQLVAKPVAVSVFYSVLIVL